MTMRVALIRAKFRALKPVMDERLTRLWAGAEAEAIGEGGITIVAEATGMSRTTIRAGRDELRRGVAAETVVKVRRAGAGRPSIEEKTPEIVNALERLIEPVTRGDLASPLRWTPKSTRILSAELGEQGFSISPQKVGQLLHASGYSLQGAEKPFEGASHAVRNQQFEFINERIEAFQRRGTPVIAVDSRKKQLVAAARNGRRESAHDGQPVPAHVHGAIDGELGRELGGVGPCGHDAAREVGWVNVGVDHDTSTFAVRSIAEWWEYMGRRAYPGAEELLITADRGGSHCARARRWKTELQRLADRIGLAIGVSHLPPGTSRWNKIEHRLLCHAIENWPGRPLVDRETVVQLIGSVRTAAELVIEATLDRSGCPTEVCGDDLESLLITEDSFHGEWNYTLHPRRDRMS